MEASSSIREEELLLLAIEEASVVEEPTTQVKVEEVVGRTTAAHPFSHEFRTEGYSSSKKSPSLVN